MIKLEKVIRMRDVWMTKSDATKAGESAKKKVLAPVLRPTGFNFPELQKTQAPLYTNDNLFSTATWQTLTRVNFHQEAGKEEGQSIPPSGRD